MTLCPYKWFLYIASAWALVYIMVETWMTFGKPALDHQQQQQQQHDEDDDDASDYESNDEDEDEAPTPLRRRAGTAKPKPRKKAAAPSPLPLLPRGHPPVSKGSGARCPFGFSSSAATA